VLVAVLALVGAACGDDDDGGAISEDTTTTEGGGDDGGGEALDVTAVDFAFEGLPEEVVGGAVTVNLDNQGEVDHEIAFVNIGEEANAATFFDDFAAVFEGGPWPEYVTNVVGANEAAPGESNAFVYTLDPGTYMVFCALTGTVEDPESEDGPPHFVSGMQQQVTVTEGESDAELPEGDGTITASDYTFDADLGAGDTVINYTNEGPNDHFAGIDGPFPEGTTVEDAEAAFATFVSLEEGQEPPPDTPQAPEFAFSGIASEGQSIQFSLPGPLEPGTYIFYCFISDRAGGPPHAIGNQMYKAFAIE